MNDTNEEKLKELELKLNSLHKLVDDLRSNLNSLLATVNCNTTSLQLIGLLIDSKEKRMTDLEVIVGSLVGINPHSGNFIKNN